ncbi:MAG: hypothetical protein H0W89_00770 [Candidatus Levybacteria bacterium]|nr:hypothetical protein [Candidatus Levybacteria bacterium]
MPEQQPREKQPSKVEAVIGRLRAIAYDTDVRPRLDARLTEARAFDPIAGIAIVNLTEVEPVTVGDREYHFHAARIADGAVTPHYHPNKGELPGQEKVTGPDDEPYYFFTDGEMNTAPVVDGVVGSWRTRNVHAGEVVVVLPNEVHTARKSDFAFACPHDHLDNYDGQTNPQGNRIMTAKVENGVITPLQENGVPPHYPTNNQ